MTDFTQPDLTTGFIWFGEERPVTAIFPIRLAWVIASAAPGKATLESPMIPLTLGYALRIWPVTLNACCWSSSEGRMVTTFNFSPCAELYFFISPIQACWVGAVGELVTIAISACLPTSATNESIRALAIPSG